MSHHFISYSHVDGEAFASALCAALEGGRPPCRMWLYQRDQRPGQDYRAQVAAAIRTADSLVFIATQDSVEPQSDCGWEYPLALQYKKPLIPILAHPDAELPPDLAPRVYIDATTSYEPAFARLRGQLLWLASPEGILHSLMDRLADATRALRRAVDAQRRIRIEDDIAVLTRQIEEQQRVVADPQAAAKRVEQRITRGLERERNPEKPVAGMSRTRFVNPPPGAAPSYFQDRESDTRRIAELLRDDAVRLVTVVGRGGVGKTALVCRLLKALESGQLPDDAGTLAVDGIVYLSAAGSRRVRLINIYSDLTTLLPAGDAERLNALYKDPMAGTDAKMRELLASFPTGCTIVLLDNFEDVVDPVTFGILDAELDEALRALLEGPQHAVKVIVTTRIAPRQLALVQPGRQRRLDLDEGLESPHAENILREMDADDRLGLRSAPPELLKEARERTRGYPRALEALFAILSSDRDTSLTRILGHAAKALPENVVHDLVGEAFSRLDSGAQQVMEALAVYGRPVTPTAVDYLLQPHVPGIDAAPVLSRLVNMQFVRKESGRYYLHEVDRVYALERVPRGVAGDREEIAHPRFTQFGLLDWAADYFRQAATPRESWNTIDDLAAQLAELDLRCAGEDYDTAAEVLLTIDYDYLYLWGYYRQMAELHERIDGKINDPVLQENSTGNQGTAHYSMGQYERAMACYERAFTLAHARSDLRSEGVWLGNMGLAWTGLGQTRRAIQCYEQAIAIARRVGNRKGEGLELGILATCYGDLGETARAIESAEQALAIARETRFRRAEGNHLDTLSEVLVDERRYEEGAERAAESVRIGAEIGSTELGSFANYHLALAYLFAGHQGRAVAAAAEARRFDEPRNNGRVLILAGAIALLEGDPVEARSAFEAALAEADGRLSRGGSDHLTHRCRAMALSGLLLSGAETAIDAIERSWHAARAINRDAGIAARDLRLLEAMAPPNQTPLFLKLRAMAAAGEPARSGP